MRAGSGSPGTSGAGLPHTSAQEDAEVPAKTEPAPAATLVIFGAMGDLARRLLIPSVLNLWRDGLLADGFEILGVSHHDASDEDLRDRLDSFAAGEAEGAVDESAWQAICARIRYQRGDFGDDATYRELAGRLDGNVAFYLATAPSFFSTVAEKLAAVGLLDEADGFRRILIEKPFGHDLASARELNERLRACARESQIYRVDHYLGKETVQNIMVARFANALFEAVWNNRYIDHVQITAAETVTVGTRGQFYDETGALRDMVPNHLFQLLAMIGMEPPNSFAGEAVRDEKAKLLAAIRPPRPEDVATIAVRGRYEGGEIDGAPVKPYREEKNIAPDSRTETYVALKLEIDSWRWAGVPFYLRTGKALALRDTEVVIQFKPVPFALFRNTDATGLPPNRLVLQIQPDEGISFGILAKRPGQRVRTSDVEMRFCYAEHFELDKHTGYETLLYDALTGDQTLFQRADMVEAGWAAVEPVLAAWREGEPEDYRAGSTGPAGADELIARDGRAWHELGVTAGGQVANDGATG